MKGKQLLFLLALLMSAATGAWAQDVSTNIVTQDNFYDYFDANGELQATVTSDELTFQGEFSNLVDIITIPDDMTLTGDNAVLNNIALRITGYDVTVTGFTLNENDADFTDGNDGAAIYVSGSDVTLDKVSVTYNAPNEVEAKAIFANGAENFTLTNSEIIFTGATPGENHYRGLEVRNSNGAKIDNNTITATFPAVPVNWANSGIDQYCVLAVGIEGGDNVEFTNNIVTVNTDGGVGSYLTIDAAMVHSANNILIKGNTITHMDATTEDGARYYYGLDIYSTTGTVEANNINVNTIGTGTAGIDRAGTAYPIQLTGPFTVTVKDNNITAISKGPVAGIYATNWSGKANLTVENNTIDVTGYVTTSDYDLVSGIEAQIDMLKAYNNTITVANDADYDDANHVYGVSMTSTYVSGTDTPVADIKDNNMTVDGKYAVYYTKAVNTNVSENALIAHELIGDAAVYIEDGDGNTVQDNLPEDMASIVTQSNFFDFFDDSGILRNTVTFDKLFFQGEFSDLAAGYVIIDKPITITGVGAVLNNMGFVIASENVTLDNMTLTATTSLGSLITVTESNVDLTNLDISYIVGDEEAIAIDVRGTDTRSGINILNNNIYFESHVSNDERYATAINLEDVEDVIVDGNIISASVPALYVETYDWSYFMMGLVYVNPIRIYEGYDVEFTNNKVDVVVNQSTSSYPTAQAMYIVGSDGVLIKGNDFTMTDTETSVGTSMYLYAVECGFNDGIEFINNNFDISTTSGQSGAGSVYVLQVATSEATIIGNNITSESNGPIVGIFSPYGFGPAKDLVIKNNLIDVTGYATESNDFALISGIEIQTGYATIFNNTINVQNKGGYDDSYPVSGISAIQYSASTLSFDIQDNDIYVPDGKYAVEMRYPPSSATVTENALIAHELTGDAAVYFKSGDNNTVENNLDAFVNMPKTGESTYNIPANVSSFKVHDDGGISGRYSSGCTGTLTLTAPEGYLLQLSGNITTETAVDYLTVYDGSDDQADVLINQLSSSVTDTETDIPTVISTDNVMTIYFHSNTSDSNNSESEISEFDGLNLTVTLIYNLNEMAGITDAINEALKGKTVNIAFSRTFEKLSDGEGKASTLCLPFDLDKPSTATVGTFYTFGGVSSDATGEYVVTMTEETADNLSAGTPYMFRPATTATGAITFQKMAYTVPDDGFTPAGTTKDDNDWEFIGTYEEKTWPKEQTETRLYGFAASNFEKSDGTLLNEVGAFRRFNYGHINPFRCYLMAPESLGARGMSKAGNQLPESMKVVLISADGTTTAIGTLDTRTGEVTFGDDWYDLNGRRLNGKPTQKGMYIHKGRKTVIK